jgi:hypothetical protein
MEFNRFGTNLPSKRYGCCAATIIQEFNVDPDTPYAIELLGGDGGMPITNCDNEALFAGPTYRDIFWQRLRYGTHWNTSSPNHTFFAILTESQINYTSGKKWLALLKEAGFEFIRTVSNSVYTGSRLYTDVPDENDFDEDYDSEDGRAYPHPNHVFALFRNVGDGCIKNPFVPPAQWTDMESKVPEAWRYVVDCSEALAEDQREAQLPLFNGLPDQLFYTKAELDKLGVPTWRAGRRVTGAAPELLPVESKKKETKPCPFGAVKVTT